MTAHTPSNEQPVASPSDTDSDVPLESDDHDSSADGEQPPSLDDLADDELICCQNPNYEFLTWFYELDADGNVLTYHQLEDFERKPGTDRIDADRSIAADGVTTTVVERDVLENRRQMARGDE